MDRDYVILISILAFTYLLSIFVNYAAGVDMLPIFNPDFCYDSFSEFWCFKAWSLIELAGICLIIYFVVAHKPDERIKS